MTMLSHVLSQNNPLSLNIDGADVNYHTERYF